MIRAAEVSDLSPLPNEIQAEQGKERKPRYITNHFFFNGVQQDCTECGGGNKL